MQYYSDVLGGSLYFTGLIDKLFWKNEIYKSSSSCGYLTKHSVKNGKSEKVKRISYLTNSKFSQRNSKYIWEVWQNSLSWFQAS